jgi:hypothetical protein
METATRSLRRLAASLLVLVTLASLASGTAQADLSPRQLYQGLLKTAPASSLPPALRGSKTRSARLSAGSRSHHAVGAVEIGNAQALVGFLVFPTRALALADLKAFPPDKGPNKVITNRPTGFPRPAYLIHAVGNGYEAVYLVFILDNLLVNSWTYGTKGSEKKLIAIVERDALWAKNRALSVMRNGS